MCENLARHDDVVAYDVNADRVQPRGKLQVADNLRQLAQDCQAIVTMLPGCQAVTNVVTELLEHKQEQDSILFIDCSTVHPKTSQTLNTLARQHHCKLIDAPVSGGVKGAMDATLTFMVGAMEDSSEFQAIAQPLLLQMGQTALSCGTIGSGAATKLCNNLALACQMVGICEALNLGEGLGVDPNVLSNVMNTSTAKCWSSQVNNPHPDVATTTPAAHNYKGGFGTNLMLKDLNLAVSAADDNQVAVPLGLTAKELYKQASLRGMGQQDFGVMMQFLRGQ